MDGPVCEGLASAFERDAAGRRAPWAAYPLRWKVGFTGSWPCRGRRATRNGCTGTRTGDSGSGTGQAPTLPTVRSRRPGLSAAQLVNVPTAEILNLAGYGAPAPGDRSPRRLPAWLQGRGRSSRLSRKGQRLPETRANGPSRRPAGRSGPNPPALPLGRPRIGYCRCRFGELVGVGAFAQLSGLTVETLRHYHQVGLLMRPRSMTAPATAATGCASCRERVPLPRCGTSACRWGVPPPSSTPLIGARGGRGSSSTAGA